MRHIITACAHGAYYNFFMNGFPITVDFQAGKESPDESIEEGVYIRRLWDQIQLLEPESRNRNCTMHVPSTGQIESPVGKRVKALNQLSATIGHEKCVAILLHLNAATNKGWHPARGHKIFYNHRHDAKQQAQAMDAYLSQPHNPLKTKSRGIKKHLAFGMLRGLKCASVLIELDFMTNKKSVKRLFEASVSGSLASFLFKHFESVRGYR